MITRIHPNPFIVLCVAVVSLFSGCAPVPSTKSIKSARATIPGTKSTRVLFMYGQKGLCTYNFSRKQFGYYGNLTLDDPDQHVRALAFAVRGSDKTISVADSQDRGYPFYSCNLSEKSLHKVGNSGQFLYASISYNPKNGLLYGVIWPGPHKDFLAILDPKSGGFHRIAPVVTGAEIAFAPNGDLYAMISGGYLDPGIENGQLYKIDPETGEHRLVGKVGLDYKSSCFTITQDGIGYVLEHTGKLRSVDLRTAKSKLLGDSGCRAAFGLFEYDVPENLLLSFQKKNEE